ncbi:MAG: Wzz/FepE/Etk N-terminal domain-containing protein [Chitinophagaceae bacterium]
MEFAYLFRALLRGKWVIAASVLIALIAAFVLTIGYKSKFKSTAQLSTGFTQADQIKIEEDGRFNPQQIDVKFNNAIENMTSPRVRSLVSYNLMLHDLESDEPFTKLNKKQKETPEFKQVDPVKASKILRNKIDSIEMLSPQNPDEKKLLKYIQLYKYDVSDIAANLQAARYQRTDYINIVYTSENQFMSAFVVNKLCDEFKRFYGLDRFDRTGRSITSLDSLVRLKKALLDEKIATKNAFMVNKGVVDPTMERQTNLSQIGSFESELVNERGQQQNYAYRVQQLDQLIATERAKGGGTSPASGSSITNNNEYVRLRAQYNTLYAEYLKNGGTDVEMRNRLNVLLKDMSALELAGDKNKANPQDLSRISIDELIQRKIDAEALLRASNQKIASLQGQINMLRSGLSGKAAIGADIGQLDKEIEIASKEYTEASNRLNLASNLNESSQTGFKQTLIGEPALRPEASKRMVTMILSGVAAFFISSLAILALAFFDKSIRTPSNFHRQVDMPLLGIVNFVKFGDSNILKRITDFNSSERDNTFRELLRKLRYEIEASRKKVFLFTSTEPQQGKTSLIQALAYSLSLGKKKVLIIDTNFCNNDLTVAIQAQPTLEKFQLNEGSFSIARAAQMISPTPIPGVDIIGCEGGDYTPTEILPKNHLLKYLDYLKEEYDFIFMEGAPLNGFTDTKELMEYAEKVIIIFSAEKAISEADQDSVTFLKDNDKFFGAILNKVQDPNLAN